MPDGGGGAAPEAAFSAADFRLRATRPGVMRPNAQGDGDHRFNPGHRRFEPGKPFRDAAVLIPVVDHGTEATVLLTKRTEALRAHSGQVAFPGGRIDPQDHDAVHAALRETQEEIGLGTDFVEIVGQLPDYLSGSGYRIAPVLGVVRPGFRLAINPQEVDVAFEVPLRFLMDPRNHSHQSRFWGEEEWFYYEMPYGGQRIWGVTAGIVRTLYERLYA